MSNRYLAWSLLIAACGLQAYLIAHGSEDFIDFETTVLPFLLHSFSRYLFQHYIIALPFYITITLTLAIPVLFAIVSWVLLGFRRKLGWNLALGVDLLFALPSLVLLSINLIYVLGHAHAKMPSNPEDLVLLLALLHILILFSPPIRTLIFDRPEPQDPNERLDFPITTAR